MSDATDNGESLTAAEERLLAYIATLRRDRPGPDPELVTTILAAARWQALARPYLVTAGSITAALGAGARLLLGSEKRT